MTREPETLSPTDTVRDALDKLNAGHFRHLPVITENRLVGIISVRDLYQSVVDHDVDRHYRAGRRTVAGLVIMVRYVCD